MSCPKCGKNGIHFRDWADTEIWYCECGCDWVKEKREKPDAVK